MANTRTLSAAAHAHAHPRADDLPGTTPLSFPPRHRLRAVDRDETAPAARVVDLLPPGATWLPAPQGAVPTLPGRPPMVGYLVLVPADQQPPLGFAPQPGRPAAAPGHPVAAAWAGAVASPVEPGRVETTGDDLISIDTGRRTAEIDGRALDLTYLEFELLAHLVAHPHRVHSRDQLVTTVWGYGHVGDGRTVDVHVARLRRKLGTGRRGVIQTVRRVGYKYVP
ncbi:winged helix-turn-helix domain-containing protein [Streptomyces sp. BI20]|uniref:winged helix-turn-helix domain-containing protein n=1 Tax=Streptomyces sp. BI20 TaxID=3403460 RepID=UPI003C768E65